MLDEEEIPEPKPIVSYAYLDDDEEEIKDILDFYEGNKKFPFSFGKNRDIMNPEIKEEIKNYHKTKEPTKLFIPYDIDLRQDANLIGPEIPKDLYSLSNDEDMNLENDNESNSDQNEEAVDYSKFLPISHNVELVHKRDQSIYSLDIDRAGNRLISGCFDGTVKIWDYTSLTRKPSPIQTIEAGDGFPVMSVSWAPTGGFFLACTGDCQAKVFDRDGNFEVGCLKGDNYLHDISNTKGHTFPITDGKWHPSDRNYFITSGRDSTIRIWDIYSKPMGIDQEIMQAKILKAKTFKNHKISISTCNYSHDGGIIVGGVDDGSLQFWSNKAGNWKPDLYIADAHRQNEEITSILFFEDNLRLMSRAMDDTLKMWDLRRPTKPLYVWDNLPNFTSKTSVVLSPDESIVLTGTSVKKGHQNSSLNFFSTYNYEKVKQLYVCQYSLMSIVWNEKINQISVGSNDGTIKQYFDLELSKNGIIHSIYKKAKTKEVDDFDYPKYYN